MHSVLNMVHYGTLWYVMVRYGPLWYIMVHYGTLWYIMVHYGTTVWHVHSDHCNDLWFASYEPFFFRVNVIAHQNTLRDIFALYTRVQYYNYFIYYQCTIITRHARRPCTVVSCSGFDDGRSCIMDEFLFIVLVEDFIVL